MKFILFFQLLAIGTAAFSQSTSISAQSSDLSENNKWDINKYVWSHTHMATSKGDKPALDYNALDNYIQLDFTLSISPDGKYFTYGTYKGSLFEKRDETLIVQSTADSWQRSYLSAKPGFFSADSKQYVFQQANNLCFLQTGSDQIRNVKQVASCKQSPKEAPKWVAYQLKNNRATLILENLLSGQTKNIENISSYDFDKSGKWLTCQLKTDDKELIIYNLESGSERHFSFVDTYALSNNGESLVINTLAKQKEDNKIELQCYTFSTDELKIIWSTSEKNISISSYSLDESGKQLVFVVKKTSGEMSDNSIWYYKAGMNNAEIKVNHQTVGLEEGLSIQGPVSFTVNGSYIQFLLQSEVELRRPAQDAIQVDVWNHKDLILQSSQLNLLNKTAPKYKAVINPNRQQVIRLERENEKLQMLEGDFALTKKSWRELSDRFWEKDYKKDSLWLISLNEGSRHLLPTVISDRMLWFSPGGNYLVYLDGEHGCHYFSYNLHTGKHVKLSAGLPYWKLGYENYYIRNDAKLPIGAGIAGWMKEDAGLLVYDNYDIWQLDLNGKLPPINITNGYGNKHKILLSLINKPRQFASDLIFQDKDTLLLTAFNRINKKNGFFRKILRLKGDPELLIMDSCQFYRVRPIDGYHASMQPIRASGANIWIVNRESAKEAPNYFVTKNFRTFKPLTNLQSQKAYNWLTAELHTFNQLDGTISQGVLYKPENFDPRKKYPVIISFYEEMSSRLYQFPTPEYIINASIFNEPAWMVSHGYLVFLPDIYFKKGQWGPSTVNSVVGAANYLSHMPYVDSKHIGACGHSNSGRFGYYLFTHSNNVFAAMSVGSGTTDVMSGAFEMESNGISNLEWAEAISFGGGLGDFWKNKSSWIDHASVLHADNVKCPILIFQNKRDHSFFQGFEMFTALRRLNKPSWWLQYDHGGHTIANSEDQKDFTIRYTQFFDHYLKGAPAPKWMTCGIPAKLKGIESGFELDPNGRCSNVCDICNGSNKRK
jgi:dipeptidyl aminopeptidase/acylaminoacyl peptidase